MNKNDTIKVIIADDHDLYRDGLKMLLSRDQEIEIVNEAYNGRILIKVVKQHKPDVVLTDLMMPDTDGIRAIREISEWDASIRCLAISTYDTDHLIIEALEAGAMGYLIKNADRGEILDAIKTVYNYHPYYCKSTTLKLARQISRSKFNPYTKENRELFSEKEKEIIRLICEEKTSEEIGKVLFMSRRTVEGMRSRILEKMNVKTPVGAVIYAIKNGIYFIEN
jgi:DNA-binding NarL/FixJ family response regulator